MVKSSKKLTKVLSFILIMCLATSMVIVSSMCTAQAQTQTTTNPNALQDAILKAMSLSDTDRGNFAKEVFETSKDQAGFDSRVNKIVSTLKIKSEDAKLAVEKFDTLSPLSKGIIITAVTDGFNATVRSYDFTTTKFPDIVKKINDLVTDDESNNDGFKMAITTLIQASKYTSNGAVATDDAANTALIKFLFDDNGTTAILNQLIKNIESLDAKGIDTFSKFMTRAAGAINKLNTTQIKEFKNYIDSIDGKLYVPYTSPSTPPSSQPSTQPSTVPSSSTSSTPSPSATATATATATPTAVTSPTPVIGEKDKQITSFSFKGIKPEAKGVIFENLRTIIVKVPVGTDIKSLEPTIEYKGASIKPESGEKKNFSHPVFYTVTAKDKSKAKYVVMVLFGSPDVVVEPAPIMPGVGPYGDIFEHWAEGNLIGLIEDGVISGYPDGSVKPNNDMTRAEVITVLVKALKLNAAEKTALKFKDLKNIPAWAKGYIQVGLDKGFIQGYPDNTFKALSKVTRAEFTVMAMKAFGLGQEDNPSLKFADNKDIIPDWAKKFVAKANGLKIINGYSDNTFRPSSFITRAEVCAIIDRCVQAAASKK